MAASHKTLTMFCVNESLSQFEKRPGSRSQVVELPSRITTKKKQNFQQL